MMVFPDPKRENPITVTIAEPGENVELKALAYIVSILEQFDKPTRQRMLNWLCETYPTVTIAER